MLVKAKASFYMWWERVERLSCYYSFTCAFRKLKIVIWDKPSLGSFKLDVDGIFKGGLGRGGGGAWFVKRLQKWCDFCFLQASGCQFYAPRVLFKGY